MRIAIIGNKKIILFGFITLIALSSLFAFFVINKSTSHVFNGERALQDVEYQVNLGPRTLGSEAHAQAVAWIVGELKTQHWQVETQEAVVSGQKITNIIAKRGEGKPWVILGSHYDSRPIADRENDPSKKNTPISGANDGASSTAILLELARVLPRKLDNQVWLVFFDAEDVGDRSGSGWANGSEYFVSTLTGKPDQVIVLDMVGDKDLNIFKEGNSDQELTMKFWDFANKLGYSQFIPTIKYNIIDDHIPFIKAGIPAIDVIDFDYPYWHTTADTLDKVSPRSLEIVGRTVQQWLEQYANGQANQD